MRIEFLSRPALRVAAATERVLRERPVTPPADRTRAVAS
jgi:hypothetical protein